MIYQLHGLGELSCDVGFPGVRKILTFEYFFFDVLYIIIISTAMLCCDNAENSLYDE